MARKLRLFSGKASTIESIKGKWVGFKFIIYNTVLPDGRIAVKMENWVDRNNDQHWEKIYEYVDSGAGEETASTVEAEPTRSLVGEVR